MVFLRIEGLDLPPILIVMLWYCQGHRHLLLRVKLHPFDSLNVQVAEERLVPAGEREPGHRGGHADVDADHAGVEVTLELTRRPAAPGENRRSVAIGTALAQRQGLVEVADADDR